MHSINNAAVIAERHARYQREAAESRLLKTNRAILREQVDSLIADLIARMAVVAVSGSERIARSTAARAEARAR